MRNQDVYLTEVKSICCAKEWRNLTLHLEHAMKDFRLLAVTNARSELVELYGQHKAHVLYSQLVSNMQHRHGIVTFESTQAFKLQSSKLQLKIREIRKQDEAPQAGADSSLSEAI